ncbi:MAG TPA: RdgB/HAM1 family non-canonical purine NTP pyrophosphatase [bacterium]|nr:RdgB/HAM1 family non-canonical purine NTP pyrophosphatase [bacterium]
MKLHFYLATKNLNKVKEVRKIMALKEIEVLPCPEKISFPEEIGKTFRENALAKASFLARNLPGEPVAGEDSGLEVEKLCGLPGVNSARFAGKHGNDKEIIAKLLDMLSKYRRVEERKAKFVTVIAFLDSKGARFFRGEVEGVISFSPRGSNGFGYDPVFELPSTGKTFAELTSEEKNMVSHRSEAFRKLSLYLLKETEKG